MAPGVDEPVIPHQEFKSFGYIAFTIPLTPWHCNKKNGLVSNPYFHD